MLVSWDIPVVAVWVMNWADTCRYFRQQGIVLTHCEILALILVAAWLDWALNTLI
jgi:hypothetical protein